MTTHDIHIASGQVPAFENPFYFDRRGEINRETVATIAEQEGSKHGGQMMPLLMAQSGAATPREGTVGLTGSSPDGTHAAAPLRWPPRW